MFLNFLQLSEKTTLKLLIHNKHLVKHFQQTHNGGKRNFVHNL